MKLLAGLVPPEAYPAELTSARRVAFGVFLFAWMTVFFAVTDAWGSEKTFVSALPSAAIVGCIAALIATLVMPWFVRRLGRR